MKKASPKSLLPGYHRAPTNLNSGRKRVSHRTFAAKGTTRMMPARCEQRRLWGIFVTMSKANSLPELPAAQEKLLAQYGFDAVAWQALRADLKAGKFPLARNRVQGTVTPPEPGDIMPWPKAGSPEAKACAAQGQAAIQRGQVAVAILNGGMATRFGGRVKGVVEVTDGHSFLALKLRHVAQTAPGAPVFIMNSFATEKDTLAHLAEHKYFGLDAKQVHCVNQGIAMRLTPAGEPVRDAHGNVSLYAPGHGDLLQAVAQSPAFKAFAAGSGRYLAVSNVDNLAATLSPRVIGAHIAGGRPVTVEVAPRAPKDAGGAPVRRDGKLEVLEGFRFPEGFDMERLPVFNTNTFVFGTAAMQPVYPLTWFRADKEVGGQPVVQFERLVGEITSFVESNYLQVPRDGDDSRFLPVKAPQDLAGIVPWVRQNLAAIPKGAAR
jgi:UTP--glucose-1-phosphate uridylyltransferase